jgi:hypothetical protein
MLRHAGSVRIALLPQVCSDGSAGSDSGVCVAPFPTHSSTNGAECRSATCLASLVAVGGGALTMTSQRDPTNASAWVTGAVKTAGKVRVSCFFALVLEVLGATS